MTLKQCVNNGTAHSCNNSNTASIPPYRKDGSNETHLLMLYPPLSKPGHPLENKTDRAELMTTEMLT
jgi:hypothetical protein